MKKFSIALHGGAGTLRRDQMNEKTEKKYRKALLVALEKGSGILEKGGTALDAVCATVVNLENCTLFNAGKGSVFNAKGRQEMDASVMDGHTKDAGAVAMLKHIKNPVLLARAVMEKSEHLLLAGKGAEKFAWKHGFKRMPKDYFFDEHRYEQLLAAQKEKAVWLDHSDHKYGTVGAVAYDQHGHVAAATSTGGMTNKKYGRIGDTPIIGSGTWADDQSCAVSCTGSGEYFMRLNLAFHISALVLYGKKNLKQAAEQLVQHMLPGIQGDGGIIAVDKKGKLQISFNTEGMYRAWQYQGQTPHAAIFQDE